MADTNKVKYGLSNVYYAKLTYKDDNSPSYDTPKAIPGAVNLSMEPSGDTTNFYADNVNYFTTSANAGYEGDLELALVPDDFRKEILGECEDSHGLQYEDADAPVQPFALLFQFEGDKNAVRHVLYNVTAARPSLESATKEDTIEVQTETLSLTGASVYFTGVDKNVPKAKCSAGAAAYERWFDSVQTPSDTTATTSIKAKSTAKTE